MDAGPEIYHAVVTERKPFTADQFRWASSDEIKCVFLVRQERDTKVVAELVKQHKDIDRITGDKISFLLIFPFQKSSDKVGPTEAQISAVSAILRDYKLKPDFIAERHTEVRVVDAFCEAFDINFDHLPAVVMFTRAFPEDAVVFSMNQDVSADDIIRWLTELRKEADKLSAREIVTSIWSLEATQRDLQHFVDTVEAKKMDLTKHLDALIQNHGLPEAAANLFVPLFPRTTHLIESFDAALREIEKQYGTNFQSTADLRVLKRVRRQLTKLAGVYRTRPIIPPDVEAIVRSAQQRANDLIDGMKKITLANTRAKRIGLAMSAGFDFSKSIRGRLSEVIKLAQAVRALWKIIGV